MADKFQNGMVIKQVRKVIRDEAGKPKLNNHQQKDFEIIKVYSKNVVAVMNSLKIGDVVQIDGTTRIITIHA